MTEHEQEEKHEATPEKRSPQATPGRKFLKVAASLLAILILAIVAIGAVGLYAYQKRVPLLNHYLGTIHDSYRFRVEKFEFLEKGIFEFGKLHVTAKKTKTERDLFFADQILVTYDLESLRSKGELDSILVTNPVITVDETTLNLISEEKKKKKSRDQAGIDLNILSRFTGSLEAKNGDLKLDLQTSPPIEAKWDFDTDKLGFGEDGMTPHPFHLSLRDIEIGDDGVFGSIKLVESRWRFNRDISRLDSELFRIVDPVVSIMPEWISQDREKPAKIENSDSTVSRLWNLDRFVLENADLKILGFDGTRPDMSKLPDIIFQTGLVEWKDLSYEEGKVDSAGPISLEVNQLEIGGGRANLIEAERAEFVFGSLGTLIENRRVKSARGHHMNILISDDSLSLWRESPKRKHSEKRKPFWVTSLDLQDASFLMTDFVSKATGQQLPRFSSHVDAKLREVSFDRFGMHSEKLQTAVWTDAILHGPGVSEEIDPIVAFPKAELEVVWDQYMTFSEVESLKIEQPLVKITDETLGNWTDPLDPLTGPVGPVNRPVFRIQDFVVTNGTLLANTRKALDGMVPKLQGGFSLQNEEIGQEDDDLGYRLRIKNLQLSNHPTAENAGGDIQPDSIFPASILPGGEPLKSEEVAKVDEAFVDFTATGIQREGSIKKITLKGGVLKVGKGLKDVVKKPVSNRQAARPGLTTAESKIVAQPVLVSLVPDELSAAEAEIDQSDEFDQANQDIQIEELQPVDPVAPVPVPTIAQPVELAQNKPDPPKPPPAPSLFPTPDDPKPKTKRKPLWKIEDLEIIGSKVDFESLIPQLEGLSFGLETKMQDIPLTAEGLLDANRIQSVKLEGIEIRDPYDSFLTVATLPAVFVDFSIAGLAKQEIDKIELVGPVVNIGESLFRWVEYLRNYRAINEGASIGIRGTDIIQGKAGKDKEAAPKDIGVNPAPGEEPDQPEKAGIKATDWVINQMNATGGKFVIAPFGVPITSLPFPFSAETNVAEGKINMTFNIPEDQSVYHIPDYFVTLYGVEGKLGLNLPVPAENNNLVQTFDLRRAKWKKLEAEDMFLTVTFDQYGIYGLFGGDAYGGYANGAFNYYLNKDGLWDAWVAGTGIAAGKLTEALVPGNLAMGGNIDVKLFMDGKNAEIKDFSGVADTVGKGWFDIVKMEKLLDNLPEKWNTLQKSLTKVAVDTLQRFDYDKGNGEIALEGNDGSILLRFDGDYGSRSLKVRIHDWRDNDESLVGTGSLANQR